MDRIGVELGAARYDVVVGAFGAEEMADLVASALSRASGAAVLVDAGLAASSPRVAPLVEALAARLPRLDRLDLEAGEASKTLAQIERSADWLARRGYDRSAALIGLGGGAAGDHTGFLASLFHRGVRFALCPTTLLAMVDASVGGKTGVDLPSGKNLVGAFHQPAVVVSDLGFLESLPARQRISGLAEVVKCGMVADAGLLLLVDAYLDGEGTTREIVGRAVAAKARVVAEDERESGKRAILNFGHTLGHALEADSGYRLLHGEAVSLGMVAALALGVKRGVTPPAVLARCRGLLRRLGLPVEFERLITPSVLARMAADKKKRSDRIRFVFCRGPGDPIWEDMPLSDVSFEEGT